MNSAISPIQEILEDFKDGKQIILTDDEGRENEGDLIFSAAFSTPEKINFMASHGRGLICLALSSAQVKRLELPMMISAKHRQGLMQTAFTFSIEARYGVTTGISAADRSVTVRAAIRPEATREDIVCPGHIFPLVADDRGVLGRPGHTEASVDLAKLVGHNPSAVICEIMNDDGTMARLTDLIAFSKKHGIKIGTIKDLIAYRKIHS